MAKVQWIMSINDKILYIEYIINMYIIMYVEDIQVYLININIKQRNKPLKQVFIHTVLELYMCKFCKYV